MYLQCWYFEGKNFKETYKIIDIKEIAEKFYKGEKTSKTTNQANENHYGKTRKHKGGTSSSLNNPKKVRPNNLKKNHTGHLRNAPTSGKACLFHGPGNYIEECKFLRYS